MQPAGQHRVLGQACGTLSESHEYSLCDVLGRMSLAGHAKGGGVDKVDVSLDQFGERSFGPVFRVVAQELLVAQVFHSPDNTRRNETRTKKSGLVHAAVAGIQLEGAQFRCDTEGKALLNSRVTK